MKNKYIAALLAFFLGGLGANKFYLGESKRGIIRLLLCWTFIPSFLGLIDGIKYIFTTNEDFQAKYCKDYQLLAAKQNAFYAKPTESVFCPSCGAKLDDRPAFCPKCGARID